MTAQELIAVRARLGLTRAELARVLRVNVRTVQFWESGERGVPGPAEVALELLVANGRGTKRVLAQAATP